jgi:hypothetical protein
LDNELNWVTASEENNAGFEIQRSFNGTSFYPVGYVHSKAPNGNSTERLNYTFSDKTAGNLKSYYRLRIMDLAQRSSHSTICIIESKEKSTLFVQSAYPNPAKDHVTLMINAPTKTEATIIVRDIAGRLLSKQAANMEQGLNSLSVYLGKFSNSTYIIEVISPAGAASIQVVKRNE